MIGLENQNAMFILISSPKLDDMVSILYAKEYQVLQIKTYYQGGYEDSVMVYSSTCDNDDLRVDILFLLNHFDEKYAIIKYRGETEVKKIFKDGSEKPLSIVMYNTDSDNMSYLYDGISFSFVESKRYWKPTKKEDFKIGMIVEYFNKNKWCEKIVENSSDEYEKLYKLLIKYDKVRVASN